MSEERGECVKIVVVGGGKPRQSARIEDPVEAGHHELVVLPTCPVRGLSPGVLGQVRRQ